MSLNNINGLYAAVDMTVATISVKCTWQGFSANIQRDSTEMTTACSGNWKTELPGRLQLSGQLEGGYVSTGTSYSDPLVWVTNNTALAIVLQADTANYLSFNGFVFSEANRVMKGATAEASKSSRTPSFRSSGAVVSTWVTT